MRIVQKKMICPNCKGEYKNKLLASYGSSTVSMANDFMKINVVTTVCPNCKLNLVNEKHIKYYNNLGELDVQVETVTFNEYLTKPQYNEIIMNLYDLGYLIDCRNIEIKGIIDVVNNNIVDNDKVAKNENQDFFEVKNHILISLINDKKSIPVYDLVIGEKIQFKSGKIIAPFCKEQLVKVNKLYQNFLKNNFKKDLYFLVKTKTKITI